MTSTDLTGSKQKPPHLFQPGTSGNPRGRPRGSRNKIAECLIEAISVGFAEHGAAVIERVRNEKPAEYLRCVIDLLPKQIDASLEIGVNANGLLNAFRAAVNALGNQVPRQAPKAIDGSKVIDG